MMHMLKLGHCVFKVCDWPLHGPPRQLTSFVLAIVTLKILHLGPTNAAIVKILD